MERIKFNRGYKEYCINDDENAVIRINTTDIRIINRIDTAMKNLKNIVHDFLALVQEEQQDEKIISALADLEKKAREQINYIFNSDVCTAAFGNMSCLSMCDGQPVCMNFIEAIVPIIKRDVEAEQKLSSKRIEKYTSQAKKFK